MKKKIKELFLKIQNLKQHFGLLLSIFLIILSFILGLVIQEEFSDLWKNVIKPWFRLTRIYSNFSLATLSLISFSLSTIFLFFLFYRFYNKKFGDNDVLSFILLDKISNRIKYSKNRNYLFLINNINNLLQEFLSGNKLFMDFKNDFFITISEIVDKKILQGGGILLPSTEDIDYLFFWMMSGDEKLSYKKFYIGDDVEKKIKRGVAGNVFINKNIEIVNILDRINRISDNPQLYNFKNDEGYLKIRSYTPYASFICIPIIYNKKVLGVLSLESQEKYFFNDDDFKFTLQILANILGIAINMELNNEK